MNEQELDEKINNQLNIYFKEVERYLQFHKGYINSDFNKVKESVVGNLKQACFQARDKWVLGEIEKIEPITWDEIQYQDGTIEERTHIDLDDIRKIFNGEAVESDIVLNIAGEL